MMQEGIRFVVHKTKIDAYTARSANCLRRHGIMKVGQILEMDRADLMCIRNFGDKTLEEITDCLLALHYFPKVANV